jgi:hypothetical protein
MTFSVEIWSCVRFWNGSKRCDILVYRMYSKCLAEPMSLNAAASKAEGSSREGASRVVAVGVGVALGYCLPAISTLCADLNREGSMSLRRE